MTPGPAPDLLLDGRFQPVEALGGGAQGIVLRCRDTRHDRSVAIKVQPVEDEEAATAEAGLLLTVPPHPHLALARDDFVESGTHHLVLDWVDGVDLDRRRVDAGGVLPMDEVAEWVAHVAEALDHLHRLPVPVAHGDVKPANIVVGKNGAAVLVDLGLAGRSSSGSYGRTEAYAAPERVAGAPPTPASDVFSLAATACELLTGSPPEPAALDLDVISPDRRAAVLSALEAGLALDPARRPSAVDLASMLRPDLGPSNLPAEPGALFGRDADVTAVTDLLDTERRLTLVGAAGIGKSRVALAASHAVRWRHPGGAWWVSLSGLRTGVAAAVAAATDAVDLATVGQPTLVVLDTCEHVLDETAVLVDELLDTAPMITVVMTSREAVRCDGEVLRSVSPLAAADAARLVGRRAGDDRLAVQGEVHALCARLECVPLALELAAARIPMIGVSEVVAGLGAEFVGLDQGKRRDPRHTSLEAALSWSSDLLDEDEHNAYVSLGVMHGPFAADAAAAVLGDENRLAPLIHASLVQAVGERFRMLDTVAAHAAAALENSVVAADARRAHLVHYSRTACALAEAYNDGDQRRALAAFGDEIRNFEWALEHGPVVDGGRALADLGNGLATYWQVRGLEGLRVALIELVVDRLRTADAAAEAVALAQLTLARVGLGAGRPESISWAERALRSAQSEKTVAASNTLASAYAQFGRIDEALRVLEELLASGADLAPHQRSAITMNLAMARAGTGDLEGARTLLLGLIPEAGAAGREDDLVNIQTNLGVVAINSGDPATARGHYASALDATLDFGAVTALPPLVFNIASCADDPEDTARLFGAGTAMVARAGITLRPADAASLDAAIDELRETLGDRVDALVAEGRGLEHDDAVALALSIARPQTP